MEAFPLTESPDWGFTEADPDVDVHEVKLGDGYVYRQPAGVNYIKDSWSPVWSNLERDAAESVYEWLKARKKVKAFTWVHPISGKVVKVICAGVTLAYPEYNNYVLSARFEQDFNPG